MSHTVHPFKVVNFSHRFSSVTIHYKQGWRQLHFLERPGLPGGIIQGMQKSAVVSASPLSCKKTGNSPAHTVADCCLSKCFYSTAVI
jgi:hypothetical protein